MLQIKEYEAAEEYFKKLKYIYPAIEWRITLNGKASDGASQAQLSIIVLAFSFLLSVLWKQ